MNLVQNPLSSTLTGAILDRLVKQWLWLCGHSWTKKKAIATSSMITDVIVLLRTMHITLHLHVHWSIKDDVAISKHRYYSSASVRSYNIYFPKRYAHACTTLSIRVRAAGNAIDGL